jgi:hypothetical protein
MSLLIVTEGATYEQRPAGTSNAGQALTQVAQSKHTTKEGFRIAGAWNLLDPGQNAPVVGEPWLIRYAHGQYVETGIVNEVIGDLA